MPKGCGGGHAEVRQVRVNAACGEGERKVIVGQVCRHVVALVVVAQSGRGDLGVDGCRCGVLCVRADVVTARMAG